MYELELLIFLVYLYEILYNLCINYEKRIELS